MFGLHRVARAAVLQKLWREGWDARDLEVFAFGQGVADAQLPVVRNTDDIASPSLFGQFAVRGEEQNRVRNRHRLFRTNMCQLHAAMEVARGQPDKGNAVTVFRVHVRLNLEHKASDLVFLGHNLTRVSGLWLRFRTVFADAVHQFFDAERVDRRAEPDRGHVALKDRLMVQFGQQFARHFDLFEEFLQKMRGDVFLQRGIGEAFNLDALGDAVAVRTIHQFETVVKQIVAAHEFFTHPNGPRRRRHVDRKVFLNFVDDVEHIAAFAVHLVTEGQDRKVTQAADFEQLLGLAFHTLCTVDHHHGCIHRRQRAVGILREVRVAGGVNEVEPKVLKVERHRRCGHGNPAILFHRHKVGPCATRFALCADLTSHLDRTTEQQELFGKSGLTGVRVRNDRERAATCDFSGQGGAI